MRKSLYDLKGMRNMSEAGAGEGKKGNGMKVSHPKEGRGLGSPCLMHCRPQRMWASLVSEYNSNYMTFWKKQEDREGKTIKVARGLGEERAG